MYIARNPENIAADLGTPEHTLLLCIASGVDWRDNPNITSVTVAVSVLKGLVERDAAGGFTLSGEGWAAVRVLFKGGYPCDRRHRNILRAGICKRICALLDSRRE